LFNVKIIKKKFSILDLDKLSECLKSLVKEQRELLSDAALSALSLTRLQQRVIILERYYVAVTRHKPVETGRSPNRKRQHAQANLNKQKWCVEFIAVLFYD
jgi:E3 ubiquitin-protein ligase HERC2